MAERTAVETDPHEGHPEAGYREEDIQKEMKKHGGDIGTLIDLLRSRYQLDREKAADYLGEIGDPGAVPSLTEALGDPAISWIAAESLGKLGDARAVQPLIAALGSDEKWLRRNAATALGRIGDPKAVGPLIKLLSDSRHDVRQAVCFSARHDWGKRIGRCARLPGERPRRESKAGSFGIDRTDRTEKN